MNEPKKIIFAVPIIPEFLYDIRHPNATLSEHLDGPHHHTAPAVVVASIPTTPMKCSCPQINATNTEQLEFLHASSSATATAASGWYNIITNNNHAQSFIELIKILFIKKKLDIVSSSILNITTTEDPEKAQRHKELLEETVAVGMMFASKAFVQLLANPIVGPLTHKYVKNKNILTIFNFYQLQFSYMSHKYNGWP